MISTNVKLHKPILTLNKNKQISSPFIFGSFLVLIFYNHGIKGMHCNQIFLSQYIFFSIEKTYSCIRGSIKWFIIAPIILFLNPTTHLTCCLLLIRLRRELSKILHSFAPKLSSILSKSFLIDSK